MRETKVEAALIKAVKKRDGLALKFVSPGFSGVPDRLILVKNGMHSVAAFVECKAPGKKMRAYQKKRKAQLEALGFQVFCLDRLEEVENIVDQICSS